MSMEENIDTHCTETQLARLAEADASVHDEIDWNHFSRCPQCLAAYAEALEHCVDRAAGKTGFPVPDDLLEAGLRTGWQPEVAAAGSTVSPRRAGRLTVPALLSTAAVLLVVLIAPQILRQRADEAPAPMHAVLVQAILADAARSLQDGLLLDGFTTVPSTEPMLVRGVTPSSADLSPDLESLERRVEAGEADDDEVYWYLCGKLLEGRIFQVQAVLSGLAPSRTRAPRIQLVEAAVAYRQSRLDDAEAILQGILAAHPDHATALFDLAQIAAERGRPAKAAEALKRVRIPAGDELLRHRVEKLSGELGI